VKPVSSPEVSPVRAGGGPAGSPQERPHARPAIGLAGQDSLRRALIGFLLAAALSLIEAGWGEIAQARHQTCLESLGELRLAPDPRELCGSEFQIYLAESVTTGLVGLLRPEVPEALAWFVMAGLYGLAGAGLAQLRPRQAVLGFLIAHAVLLAILVAANYLSQFIVTSPG